MEGDVLPGTFDFILDTVAAAHDLDLDALTSLLNTAYERRLKSDVKYRFVIDLASLARG